MNNKKEKELKNYLNKSNNNNAKRKLAAIMFTDIAGYTSLSARNETKAIEILSKQRKILNPIIKKFKGILHKEIGDGLLLTFPTVTDAIKCGINIQNELKKEKDLNIRIGIHEGEVTLKNNDVLGDDVNIASRIQEYSPIGGIVISNKIQQNIASLNEYKTKYLGSPNLKGVMQDIKLYCIISHDLSKNLIKIKNYSKIKKYTSFFLIFCFVLSFFYLKKQSSNINNIPSIGIVMFENICNKEENYWIKGYYEDLILEIAKSGTVKVSKIDSKENSNNQVLHDYTLSNSICKKDSIIDIRINLTNNNKGNSLFAKKWTENTNKSEQIILKISNQILKAINPNFKKELIKNLQIEPKSKELYYLARKKYFEKTNYEELLECKSLLQSSIILDSNYIKPRNLLFSLKYDIGESDDLINFSKETYNIASSIKDTAGMIDAIINMVAVDTISFENRVKYLNKGIELAKQTKNIYQLANVYRRYGDTYNRESLQFQYPYDNEKWTKLKKKTLEYFLLSEQFYIIEGKKAFSLLNKIGDLYRELEERDKAYKYYIKAINYGNKNNYKYSTYYYSKMQIASILKNQKKYTLSNEYLLDAYKFYFATKNKMALYHVLGYMLTNYSELNDKEMIYKYYLEYFKITELIDEDFYREGSYNNLKSIFKKINDENLYKKYLRLYEENKKRLESKNK